MAEERVRMKAGCCSNMTGALLGMVNMTRKDMEAGWDSNCGLGLNFRIHPDRSNQFPFLELIKRGFRIQPPA